MLTILDLPLAILVVSLVTLWVATRIGALLVKKLRPVADEELTDLDVVKNSALTLLVLLIGFSFSMAVNRYDQRKNHEAEEANAIGTEYVRASLLSPADSDKVRELLRSYLDQRVLFYETRDERKLAQINDQTANLEDRLWSAIQNVATPPSPIAALAVGGMNDVLNTQ